MGLVLDRKSHEYRLDGRRLAGVTEVIEAAGMMPPMYGPADWYLGRGSAVHAATALLDEGTLDEASVDPQAAGYVDAYRAMRTTVGTDLVVQEIETSRYHETLGYAGTPDRVVRWRGRLGVLEIKCGVDAGWHAIQLASYLRLVQGAETRLTVYLQKDGKWNLDECKPQNQRADFDTFLAALTLYRWREAHGVLVA